MTGERSGKCRLARLLFVLSLLVPLGGCEGVAVSMLFIPTIPSAIANAIISDDAVNRPSARKHAIQLDIASCGGKGAMQVAQNYEKGQGTEKDLKEAYFWYSLAAKDRVRFAARDRREVGERLKPDESAELDIRVKEWVPRDCSEFIMPADRRERSFEHLYRASCGEGRSQEEVSKAYERGWGTEKYLKEAYFWYSLMAKQWNRNAAIKRREVGNHLTSEERAEIDVRVEAWAPRDCAGEIWQGARRERHLEDLERASCGNVWAQLQIASDFEKGYGAEKDLRESYFWYSRAAKDWGFRRAALGREEAGEELTPEERTEIDNRVEAWAPPDCPSGGNMNQS